MNNIKNKHIAIIITFLAVMTIIGCSTQKNTSTTRWWHSFNARYNTYYNGSLAYIDASLEKENGNKDNFTELLPLYTVGNKSSRELGKGNYDRAIEKCQKVIKLHSIKKRPEWNKSRKKTAKDIEWLKLAHEQEKAATGLGDISDGRQEAVEALVALGYSSTDALRAVRKVTDVAPDDVEGLLKAALKNF